MITRLLDLVGQASFRALHSRPTRVGAIVVLLCSLALLALARPANEAQKRIEDREIKDISSLTLNQWVRVTGVLQPQAAYRTRTQLGGLQIGGSRYVPMIGPGAYDPLFVLDENIPPAALTGQPATLVGQITEGVGVQPPLYLQIGYPPDVLLMNALARVGLVVVIITLAAMLVARAVERVDFAVRSPFAAAPSPAAPELMWFGSIGHGYGNATVRGAPVALNAIRREASFAPSGATSARWTVNVRRMLSARSVTLATRHGSLAGAQLTYEDERGLVNRATLAANSPQTRDAVIELLRYIGNV